MIKGKPIIVVVDDEPSVLVTYQLILEQQGYSVRPAPTSADAIRALADGKVDLLLCDLSLETETSGFGVIQQARESYPDLPIVLLTGYADHESTERAQRDAIPVLFKPIDMSELLGTIETIMKGESDARNQTRASQDG